MLMNEPKLVTPRRIDEIHPAALLRQQQRQAIEAARRRDKARDDVQLNGWLQKKAQQVKKIARQVYTGLTIPARLVVNAVAPNSKLATSKQNLREAAATTLKVAAAGAGIAVAAPFIASAASSAGAAASSAASSVSAGAASAGSAALKYFGGGGGSGGASAAPPVDIPSVTTPTVPQIVESALNDYLSPKPQAPVDRPVDLSAPVEVPRSDFATPVKKFSLSDIPPWALVGGGLLVLSMMKG